MRSVTRVIYAVYLTLVVLVSPLVSIADSYAFTGSGTSGDPYLISTCADLQDISSDVTSSYRLINNIDCSDTANWNGDAGFVPIGDSLAPFQGTLDGAGYAISGLTINRPSTDYVGLFGYMSGAGLAHNIRLDNVSIIGKNYVGGVVGKNFLASIEEIGITGEVGGITEVGGVIGDNGGFVTNVYSRATISGVPGSGLGGGLTGENEGFIFGGYSTGSVPNGPGKGGAIGYDDDSGGSGDLYWDTQTSGIAVSAGGSIGKTTAELKNVATFTTTDAAHGIGAWDFVGNPNDDTATDDTWNIDPLINQGYPYLAAQYPVVSNITVAITNPSSILRTHGGATQSKLHRYVALAQASTSTSTPSQDTTTSDDTTEHGNSDSVAKAHNSSDDIKNPAITHTHFTPWVIAGSSSLLLILIGYLVYRRLRTAA